MSGPLTNNCCSSNQVVTGKFYDAVLALATALHFMILDGYDVRGQELGFNFDKGPVTPWRNGEELMKYIKKAIKYFFFSVVYI